MRKNILSKLSVLILAILLLPSYVFAETAKATEIKSIEIRKAGDLVKVLIAGNGPMTPNVFPDNEKIVVDIPNVTMNAAIPANTMSPLKALRAGSQKDKTRIVLDLKEKTTFDVAAIGSTIEISLKEAVVPAASTNDTKTATDSVYAKETVGSSAPEPLTEGTYTGKKISLDFQDADIIPIFRLLADVSGYNIVVNPGVSGKITLKLINVPWDQALDLILRTFSLSKISDGNIIRIVPTSVVSKELKEIADSKKAASEAGDLKTRIFTVNYAEVEKIKDGIDKAKLLSSRGSLSVDKESSTITVNDLELNLKKVEAHLKEMDTESLYARQVVIEAKIVEVSSTYTKDLGIQWGFFHKNTQTFGDNTSTIGALGRTSTGTTPEFLVNLPTTKGQFGGIGFGYINKAATFALDLQLSAMETLNKGKVISNPKIMTRNNQEAKITQGSTIYLQSTTTGSNTASFTAVDANLSLTVKPRIAPGGAVFMDIDITKDEPGALVGTNVSVFKNTAKTSVLVQDSATIVIGGIMKKSVTTIDNGIPGLSKIPLIGKLLFNQENNVVDDQELLIFVTPRVVEAKAID